VLTKCGCGGDDGKFFGKQLSNDFPKSRTTNPDLVDPIIE
jgi:hypothetical protein